jgi:pimeloyl-ACP methyl ester carboxylesterase
MSTLKEAVISLPGGRTVAYVDWGPRGAPALLYCHGFPGTYRELQLSLPTVERHGVRVRVIALNRPGYGKSTFLKNRRFLDWPHDVTTVADHLGIDRFGVLGASGGSPYALACAFALRDRVTRVGIVVGAAPVDAPGMRDTPTFTGWSSISAVRRLQFGAAAAAIKTGRQEGIMNRVVATLGEPDRIAMERPEVRQWFLGVVRQAYSQGGRGGAYEFGLYAKPWGFDLDRITAETSLWYGGEDTWVPASAGRWLADRLPNARYSVWPEHGHFSWATSERAAEVVAGIAASPN